MKEHQISNVEYVDKKNEKSTRTIIPYKIPEENIRAIDVSDLPEGEREEMRQYLTEYNNYIKSLENQRFTLEDFISHSKGKEIKPKWRFFNKDRIKEL